MQAFKCNHRAAYHLHVKTSALTVARAHRCILYPHTMLLSVSKHIHTHAHSIDDNFLHEI